MKRDISGIFQLQILLFAFSVILVLMIGSLLIHGRYQRLRIASDFHHELSLAAKDFSHKIQTAEENLKALSSRSMIRNALSSLSRGEETLERTRDYTQPKFADGVRVYSQILYARRLDDRGRLIAEYPPGNPEGIAFTDREISFYCDVRGCHIVLNYPILEGGRPIGRDQAVFFLSDLKHGSFALVRDLSVTETPPEGPLREGRAEAVPLEGTGYSLFGWLDGEAAARERRETLGRSLLEGLVLIAVLALISYFTIMRLMVRLIREQNRSHGESLKKDKEDAISQIIAGLAHEMNNVLTGIFGLSDSLEMLPDFPDEGKPLLDNLRESSSRMAQFMKKLTDYNRQNIFGRGRVNLKSALEGIIDGRRKELSSGAGIKLTVPAGEIVLDMAPHHLNQIAVNLLENARESMGGEGFIEVGLEKRESLTQEECPRCGEVLGRPWIRMSFRDRGKGISPAHLPRIFDPFFTTKDGKDGLGLAQASGIAARYGGHIFVEETSEDGSVFTLLLPAEMEILR